MAVRRLSGPRMDAARPAGAHFAPHAIECGGGVEVLIAIARRPSSFLCFLRPFQRSCSPAYWREFLPLGRVRPAAQFLRLFWSTGVGIISVLMALDFSVWAR